MGNKRRKSTVVIGLLGVDRDRRSAEHRPSVALCRQPEILQVDRFELLYQPKYRDLAEELKVDIEGISPATTVRLHTWDPSDAWDFQEVYGLLFDFARSYEFRPAQEEYLVHMTTGSSVMKICLFLLTARRYLLAELVVTTLRPGDTKESVKRINLEHAGYEQMVQGLHRERQEQRDVLAGEVRWGGTFLTLLDEVVSISCKSRAPLLLTGPTGSGKSILARHIYEMKKSRNLVTGALIEVNCATLRGERAGSDLFGHTQGAFTGADRAREGLIVQAHKGILFLDEVSELEPEAQAMLLTALDTREFLPVGSDEYVNIDFELITATNRDLQQEVRAGRFREDLYYRISALPFDLPGLDRRRDDIEPFVDFVLSECSREFYEMRIQMDADARKAFLCFAVTTEWRGNLRQLKQTVLRMAARAEEGRITRREVDRVLAALTVDQERSEEAADETLLASLVPADKLEGLDNLERVQLAYVLRVCRRNPSMAAAGRHLFDKSRQKKESSNDTDRLSKLLKKHGLSWDQVRFASQAGESE